MFTIVDDQSKDDIKQDCNIAHYRLQELKDLIDDMKAYPHFQIENKKQCAFLEKTLNTLKNHFKKLEETVPTIQTTCYTLRFRLSQRLRYLDKAIVSLYTNQSWQSPSKSNIFRQGITPPKYNYEYQRIELNRETIEKKLNTFHQHIPETIQETLILNSAMGSFSLIMASLQEKMIIENTYIAVGNQSYFEIKGYFKENKSIRSKFVDEDDIESIIDCAVDESCTAINLDIITSTFDTYYLDCNSLFTKLSRIKRTTPLYLLLDTTLMGPSFQCSDYIDTKNWPNYLHVITYRSLQKFDQYGDDKVSGGSLTVISKDKESILPLNKYRGILGINCPEQNLLSFCLDNKITTQRLDRINRNGHFLFQKLKTNTNLKANYNQAGLLFLKLENTEKNNQQKYEHYIQECINKNFENGLFLIDSNSFGFNYTHIMLVNDKETGLYIRIAPGMETLADMKKFNF